MATVELYDAGAVSWADVRRRLSAFYPEPQTVTVTKTVTVIKTVYVSEPTSTAQQIRDMAQRYDVPLRYRGKLSLFAGKRRLR